MLDCGTLDQVEDLTVGAQLEIVALFGESVECGGHPWNHKGYETKFTKHIHI